MLVSMTCSTTTTDPDMRARRHPIRNASFEQGEKSTGNKI